MHYHLPAMPVAQDCLVILTDTYTASYVRLYIESYFYIPLCLPDNAQWPGSNLGWFNLLESSNCMDSVVLIYIIPANTVITGLVDNLHT